MHLPANSGTAERPTDRPTNQQTDMRVNREVTLPNTVVPERGSAFKCLVRSVERATGKGILEDTLVQFIQMLDKINENLRWGRGGVPNI